MINQALRNELTDNQTFFETNYEAIAFYEISTGGKRYLGERGANRKCRFCGRGIGEVTFRAKAHALPELIGNKSLISLYECDDCNIRIFHKLDNHLANFLGIWRIFSQIKGKKGIPSYRSKKRSRIDVKAKGFGFEINNYFDDPIIEEDESAKELIINAIRQSYIPINVFKSLTKMALSIMPENELIYFQETIKWILKDVEKDDISFNYLPLLYEFVPGQNPFRAITTALLKRKESTLHNVPYMYFFLTFKNIRLQIYIPLNEKDKDLKGKVTLHHFPSRYCFMDDYPYGNPQLGIHDLSPHELIKNEEDRLSIKYESKVRANK